MRVLHLEIDRLETANIQLLVDLIKISANEAKKIQALILLSFIIFADEGFVS